MKSRYLMGVVVCVVGCLLGGCNVQYMVPASKAGAPARIQSETVSPTPADRTRTTLGIGEQVNLLFVPLQSVTWWVTGGGLVYPLTGNSSKFTASMSPSTSTVHAVTSSGSVITKVFTVIAPDSESAGGHTDIGLGAYGPPNRHVGAWTEYNVTVQPTTVSFRWAHFQEDFPDREWTWPNGHVDAETAHTVAWQPLTYANGSPDQICMGPWDIELLDDGTGYVGWSFTLMWAEQYQNEAGIWVTFGGSDDLLLRFSEVDQSCRVWRTGIPGEWQGPWQ